MASSSTSINTLGSEKEVLGETQNGYVSIEKVSQLNASMQLQKPKLKLSMRKKELSSGENLKPMCHPGFLDNPPLGKEALEWEQDDDTMGHISPWRKFPWEVEKGGFDGVAVWVVLKSEAMSVTYMMLLDSLPDKDTCVRNN
ncbi:hypothetical protein QJS04_geneDACA003949 [Acorus gramineus]|uniref:Uncharacterized protein n=1 Tax=Acorus gramineus TaxID=55184 RepID=A0AAV9BFK9_ACOGR|nr:hypothetical protein QJS04_geneDACA003949 [Acorus gramineus]